MNCTKNHDWLFQTHAVKHEIAIPTFPRLQDRLCQKKREDEAKIEYLKSELFHIHSSVTLFHLQYNRNLQLVEWHLHKNDYKHECKRNKKKFATSKNYNELIERMYSNLTLAMLIYGGR